MLHDPTTPITADVLASRFYSQRRRSGWLSAAQTSWLVRLWMRRPITSRDTAPYLSGAGTLLDRNGATIGRWELTQDRRTGTGKIRYFLLDATTRRSNGLKRAA